MGRPRKAKAKKEEAAPAAPVLEEGTPEWFKKQGNERFAIGDYKGAVASYTEAIELDGTNKVFFSNRSAAYAAFGSISGFKRALLDAEQAVTLDPEWSKAYYRKGKALEGLGQYRLAKAALERGKDLAAVDAEFTVALEMLAKMGVTDKLSEIEKEAVPLSAVVEGEGGASAEGAAGAGGEGAGDLTTMAELEAEEDKFEGLERWLKEHGSSFPMLYMKRYSENYRGVHIRQAVPKETEIMRIGAKCLITVEMGKECPIGLKMQAARVDVSASKHCYVSVFVLWDRKNLDSHFQPYYRILPTEYPNMPIFWSAEQLDWLKGSYLLTQIADRKRNIKADYDEICRAAPEFATLATLHEFMWARMMVASRNFGITFGKTKTDALVPLADMLNHYRPRETKWTFDNGITPDGAFTITSLSRLQAGQQVYDSYGKKCNSRFLLNYGFAVDHNVDPDGQCHNEVRVSFRMQGREDDPHYDTKLGLLNGASSSRGIRVSSWLDLESTREAFSFLRFVYARGSELLLLPQLGENYELGKKPIPPISCGNEVKVLSALQHAMATQLAKYPTTLEEDLATLEAGTYPFGSDRRNAIVILKGEKQVCHHYLQLAELCIPLLQLDYRDAKKRLQSRKRSTDDIEKYVSKVVVLLLRKKAADAGRLK